VTLSPFFLTKYEMTQGQWLRLVDKNPSYYQPPHSLAPSLLHPVEQVGWLNCMSVMERLGLSLPSEAQWEYGARAGTTSMWWPGNERESLLGAANLADQAAARAGAQWWDIKDWPQLDDGFAMHAPVERFAPNGFGLHNVHGNVLELCLDGYDGGFYEQAASKDPVFLPKGSSIRISRGGSFASTAVLARSAYRMGTTLSFAGANIGLRPARTIAP
jgi:formylglycine-generating enzyme required for sulfatase activity